MSTAADAVTGLWKVYGTGRTRPLSWRQEQLNGLIALLIERTGELQEALREDLRKPAFESYASDVGGVLAQVRATLKLLPRQLADRPVRTPLMLQPAKSYLRPEPWGVVLLMPAWNYPVGLSILPLAGAVAGGNAVALKPSELAPASSRALAELLPRYIDSEAVTVVEGDQQTSAELLAQRFGHIHFTGSTAVGRIVMRAAADHLTPVTLELGGKNPAYVHASADISSAANRIAWGRMFNAGQTCLSPDYVLVDREVEPEFTRAVVAYLKRAYGPEPQRSPDLARIINKRHHDRVSALLRDAGEVIHGGSTDPDELYIAPTLIRGTNLEHPLMREEIFGPVLPIVAVDGLESALSILADRPQPLAAYAFAKQEAVVERFSEQVSAGGIVINHVFVHANNNNLPFGGVGESGMGHYLGAFNFECFTHWKPVMRSRPRPDVSLLYPPYPAWKSKLLSRVFR